MKKIAAYLRPYLGRMSLGLLIKFIGTIMDLLLPWILATTIDHVVPTKSIPAILLWGGMMVVCSVVALVANIVANRMASGWRGTPPGGFGTICLTRSSASPVARWTASPFPRWKHG